MYFRINLIDSKNHIRNVFSFSVQNLATLKFHFICFCLSLLYLPSFYRFWEDGQQQVSMAKHAQESCKVKTCVCVTSKEKTQRKVCWRESYGCKREMKKKWTSVWTFVKQRENVSPVSTMTKSEVQKKNYIYFFSSLMCVLMH